MMSERFEDQINHIIELTTRVDERVQSLMKHQHVLENKLDGQIDDINDLNIKIKIIETQDIDSILQEVKEIRSALHKLELKLQVLESSSTNQEARWKTIFSFSLQLVWVVLAAFLLYKLGLQAPAVP